MISMISKNCLSIWVPTYQTSRVPGTNRSWRLWQPRSCGSFHKPMARPPTMELFSFGTQLVFGFFFIALMFGFFKNSKNNNHNDNDSDSDNNIFLHKSRARTWPTPCGASPPSPGRAEPCRSSRPWQGRRWTSEPRRQRGTAKGGRNGRRMLKCINNINIQNTLSTYWIDRW